MENSVSSALDKFFNQLEDDKKEKYKSGVLDFVLKLNALVVALKEKDEKAIAALLHSVKPISEYLELTDLHTVLLKISTENTSNYLKTIPLIESQITQIENQLKLY